MNFKHILPCILLVLAACSEPRDNIELCQGIQDVFDAAAQDFKPYDGVHLRTDTQLGFIKRKHYVSAFDFTGMERCGYVVARAPTEYAKDGLYGGNFFGCDSGEQNNRIGQNAYYQKLINQIESCSVISEMQKEDLGASNGGATAWRMRQTSSLKDSNLPVTYRVLVFMGPDQQGNQFRNRVGFFIERHVGSELLFNNLAHIVG